MSENNLVSIPGIKGYYVDNKGNIWSTETNWRGHGKRILKKQKDRYGYEKVRLTINGKRKKYSVHRLICAAFYGEQYNNNLEVRHLNGIRDDNKLENLCWGTRSENAFDRSIHSDDSYRFSNNRKLTVFDVEKIRTEEINIKNSELAKKYNVTSSCISNIKNYVTWKNKGESQ